MDKVVSDLSEYLITTVNQPAKRKNKQPKKDPLHLKKIWWAGYDSWSDEEFKEWVRVNHETFDFILEQIAHLIHKEPAYTVPNLIKIYRQLGLKSYRIAHGGLFKVIMDIFGVGQSLAKKTFNAVIKCLVLTLYDDFFADEEQKHIRQTNLKAS